MLRNYILFSVLLPVLVIAQPSGFLSIQNTNLINYKEITRNFYDGKSLFGYIDGKANLYLEYGFEGLLVQEIQYNGIKAKCEIFRMTDPIVAFGIFSVSRHKCQIDTNLLSLHCINNFQTQVCKGNYYLSIINEIGDSFAKAVTLCIAQKLADKLEEMPILVPQYFEEILFAGAENMVFIKGPVALGNMSPLAIPYFGNSSAYNIWMVPSQELNEPTLSVITFQNENDLKNYFALAFPENKAGKIIEKKLKNGNKRIAKILNSTTVFQAEGRIDREYQHYLFA